MTEPSIEQAALARAARDALPAPWPDVIASLESLGATDKALLRGFQAVADDTVLLWKNVAALRDEFVSTLDALTNRIEALTRAVGAPTFGRHPFEGKPTFGRHPFEGNPSQMCQYMNGDGHKCLRGRRDPLHIA